MKISTLKSNNVESHPILSIVDCAVNYSEHQVKSYLVSKPKIPILKRKGINIIQLIDYTYERYVKF